MKAHSADSVHRRSLRRKGVAVVELAVSVPVIVLIVFASLEGANMLYVRQAVVQSAYEAAKAAAKSRGSESAGRGLATSILASRNITKSNIQFAPSGIDNLAPGTPFTVTVSVPSDSRSITRAGPFRGLNIQVQATMLKE